MNVGELKEALKKVPDDTKLELSDGSTIDDVCFNAINKRLCLSTQDDRVIEENLAEGWYYLVKA